MMPSWFRWSYLFWAPKEVRHTAQMSHTAHTTRLYKCHTQSVQLDKHSAKKKKSCMYLRSDIDDNCSHQQWCWCDSSWLSSRLTHWHHCCCSHHSRWQWERHCCVQNSDMHDHVTCSYCNTHQNVLMYDDISKERHTMSDSWQ
jgi:hypothetical protein